MEVIQNAGALNVAGSIPLLTAFVQGILSFFSPCVLPLLPVYLTVLAGGDAAASRKRTLLHTLCFVLGISAALMLLGAAFSSLGQFLRAWRAQVNLVCGAVVVLFGLVQLGVLGQGGALQREYRLPLRLEQLRMNPLTALLMGLCFSFSWTPCIGPTLTGILMTAAAAATRQRGVLLMAAYILGFVLPFLALGLFTQGALGFFRKHRGVVRWTAAVSGALLVLMGILIMTGTMGRWSSLIASAAAEEAAAEEPAEEAASGDETVFAPDFTLEDQYGETHTLSEYRGKVVFLNFWTTWCPWCVKEMPEIEELYHELGGNAGDVVILGVDAPSSVDTASEEEIIAFLEEKGLTYPTVMDRTGEVFNTYQVASLPTTWIIKADGSILGYVPGALEKSQMIEIIEMGK